MRAIAAPRNQLFFMTTSIFMTTPIRFALIGFGSSDRAAGLRDRPAGCENDRERGDHRDAHDDRHVGLLNGLPRELPDAGQP